MADSCPNLTPLRGDLVVTEVQQTPSEEARRMLESLQTAVRKCLERKRRLGQFAVIWKDGQPQRLMPHPTESTP